MGSGTSFRPISVPSVCEGARLARLTEDKILKTKFQIFIPLIEFIIEYNLSFSSEGLGFQLLPLDQELVLEKNYNGFLKFETFN